MNEDQLTLLRRRILLPWQVQRGSNVWAPWGKSGWSAVEIREPQRKWAKGLRVKPATGEEVAKGKVPIGRLLKRDPMLKGKDRPSLTPDEIFAAPPTDEASAEAPESSKDDPAHTAGTHARRIGAYAETSEQRKLRLSPPGWKPEEERTKKEQAAHEASLEKLYDEFGDSLTTEEW